MATESSPEQFTTIAECGCKYQLVTINKDGAVLFDLRVTQCSIHLAAGDLLKACENMERIHGHESYSRKLQKYILCPCDACKMNRAVIAKAMPPHMHVSNGKDDACKRCGKDLRDPIHTKGK